VAAIADAHAPFSYAGFAIRVAANAVDMLILAALNMAYSIASYEVFGPGPGIGSVSGRYFTALVGTVRRRRLLVDRHRSAQPGLARRARADPGRAALTGRAMRPVLISVVAGLLAARLAGAQSAPPSGNWRLQLPDKPWALVIDLPGFVLDEQWPGRNGTRRMIRAHDPDTSVIVSAFLERNPELTAKEQCRDLYWAKSQKSPNAYSDVTMPVRGPMAFVRGFVAEAHGRRVRWQNVHAHLFRDGVCMEIHLSKTLYEPDDERLFEAVLRTVRFADTR
jgi:hypothetical protein